MNGGKATIDISQAFKKPYAFISMAQLVKDFNADATRYLEGDDNESDL